MYFQGCRPSYRRSKTSKQIQSVAKQFGSIGKKLKKNLGQFSKGALTRKGSFRGDQRTAQYEQGYIQGTNCKTRILWINILKHKLNMLEIMPLKCDVIFTYSRWMQKSDEPAGYSRWEC